MDQTLHYSLIHARSNREKLNSCLNFVKTEQSILRGNSNTVINANVTSG